MGFAGLSLVGGLWWGLSHYKSKSERLAKELKTAKTTIEHKNAEIIEFGRIDADNQILIGELEQTNLEWANLHKQTKDQFEQASKKQQANINEIRNKYNEARKKSTDTDILSDYTVSLRESACRYCDKDPFGGSQSADDVPD